MKKLKSFQILVTCIRSGFESEHDLIIHKQVIDTYIPEIEILNLKCLLMDTVSESGSDPI